MGKYRKKPVVIEAMQLNWKNWNEICDFLGNIVGPHNPARKATGYSDNCEEQGPEYIELTIPTLEGEHIAKHGDWIIKGIKGEFYPCKPDIFDATYDKVVETTCESAEMCDPATPCEAGEPCNDHPGNTEGGAPLTGACGPPDAE